MPRKLTSDEVTDLIYAMSEMLFTPEGVKYEAETVFDQTRLDTALRVVLLAMAEKEPRQPPELKALSGGKAD